MYVIFSFDLASTNVKGITNTAECVSVSSPRFLFEKGNGFLF